MILFGLWTIHIPLTNFSKAYYINGLIYWEFQVFIILKDIKENKIKPIVGIIMLKTERLSMFYVLFSIFTQSSGLLGSKLRKNLCLY